MAEPIRVNVKEARQRVQGGKALLVCGYEDDVKFRAFPLDGAISFKELSGRLSSLSKDQEIIFY